MRKSYPPYRALRLLEEADAILAQGGLLADVCRTLGMSHVVYKRLLARYRGERKRPLTPSEVRWR
jgi:hypothetical protein